MQALLVGLGDAVVALPLDAVRCTVQVDARSVATTRSGESLVHEGIALPLADLGRVLSRAERTRRAATRPAVLVERPDGCAALVVDRLLGVARVIVRPLPPLAPADPVVAGTFLDAEGRPQLVLEASAVVAAARRPFAPEREAVPERRPILVVDDSLTTRMLEQSILESAGYAVELATSAEEALEKAARRPYALFLVDVEMPGMDGFAFIERTRADAALRSIPAILVTSRCAPADRARGDAVGARGYVVKGEFDQNAVLRRIRELVG
jgi:two-component system chemotaxis sensor kinase CheA